MRRPLFWVAQPEMGFSRAPCIPNGMRQRDCRIGTLRWDTVPRFYLSHGQTAEAAGVPASSQSTRKELPFSLHAAAPPWRAMFRFVVVGTVPPQTSDGLRPALPQRMPTTPHSSGNVGAYPHECRTRTASPSRQFGWGLPPGLMRYRGCESSPSEPWG